MPCIAFPHISWWARALHSGTEINLYTGSPQRNISYRNRYRIGTANGPLLLSIPIKGGRRYSAALADTMIDYTHDWQRQHWRTLFSAYGRAPFFEHFGPELEALIFAGPRSLLDFNLASIEWLRKSMRVDLVFKQTTVLTPESKTLYEQLARPEEAVDGLSYNQVFGERLGFLPDLSAIDLLMAEGPYAGRWISQIGH